MKKFIYGILVGIAIVALPIIFIFSNVFSYVKFYEQVTNKFDGTYDQAEMQEAIYSGIVYGLGDTHSNYLPKDYMDDFNQSLDTSYEGIGIGISADSKNGTATVTQVFDGGAASEEDIYPGDMITTVNGEKITTDNVDKISDMIKAKPEVKLEVYRPSTDKIIEINTKGKTYTQPSVSSQIIKHDGKKYGYININSFSSTTGDEFKEQLDKLEKIGFEKLIIDVRNNPGGEVNQLEKVADQIVENTKPYLTIKKGDHIDKQYTSKLSENKNYDIIGLMNENSASAAEILMASIKEINNSELIGQTTYGKGSVQQVIPVDETGGAVKLTIEHWFTPDDHQIDKKGIKPTVELDDKSVDVEPIVLDQQLTVNSEGDNVKLVKQYLHLLGYDIDTTSTVYTKETSDAVKLFQKDNNLESTGIIDVATAKELYEQAKKQEHTYENDNYVKKAIDLGV